MTTWPKPAPRCLSEVSPRSSGHAGRNKTPPSSESERRGFYLKIRPNEIEKHTNILEYVRMFFGKVSSRGKTRVFVLCFYIIK